METKKDMRNLIIVLAIGVISCFMPGIGVLTRSGMQVLLMFVAILFGWSQGVTGWAALILMMLYSLSTGLNFTTSVVPDMFSNYIVLMLIISFWFVAAVQSSGLVDYLAKKIFSLKIARKGPYYLMSLFLLAGWFISIFVQAAIAVEVLLLALLKKVSNDLNLPKYNMWTTITGLGIGLWTLLGVMILPFNANTVTVYGLLGASYGVSSLPTGPYIIYQLVFQLVCIALMVAITKFIIRPKVDFSGLQNITLVDSRQQKMPRQVKYAIAGVAALFIVMFVPVIAPSSSMAYSVANTLNLTAAFTLGTVIICFAKDDNGNHVFNFSKSAKTAVAWDVILFFAALLYFANLLNSEETGIPQLFAQISQPLSNLSPMMVIVIISLIVTLLTNVMNNLVTIVLFAPIGFSIIGTDNIYSSLFMMMLIVAGYLSIALPPSSSTAVFVHSEKDMFKSSQLILWGYVFCFIFCIVAVALLVLMQGLFV